MEPQKRYWSPTCDADDCDQPAQYHVYDQYGKRLAGEWCNEHADATIEHLKKYEKQLRRHG